MGERRPRVLHITHSSSRGGADIAAHRIHNSLLGIGADSTMTVVDRDEASGDLQLPQSSSLAAIRGNLTDWALLTQKSANGVHRSLNAVSSGSLSWIDSWKQAAGPESIIHLHWVGSDTLSVAEIGRLPGPVVWTMHDSWPFCGAEHHPANSEDDRFTVGYTRGSRQPGDSRIDLDAWTYRRKVRHWKRPMFLVGPSRWMVEQAHRSRLAGSWPNTVIPNPIDIEVFAPMDQRVARDALGLPQDVPLIMFGALGGGVFRNKGWDLLEPALATVAERVPQAQAVVVGSDNPPEGESLPMQVHNLGRMDSAQDMARVYSASSVFVNPSRMESFSQTAAEAQACGIPVVAFAHTGLLDVVSSGETGLLVTPESVTELAAAIAKVISDDELASRLGRAGRERAVQLWAPAVVGGQYLRAYEQASDLLPS